MIAEMDVSNKNVKKQIIGHFEQKQVFFWNPETNHLTSGHCIIAEIKHAGNVFHLILVPKFDSLV